MSFTKKVTTKGGVEKTVVADNQAELDEAVRAAEQERAPVTVDINVPVPKGRDLLHVEEDGVVQGLSDGRGAHNSPRSAVRDDGSVEGDPNVPILVQRRNLNVSETAAENQFKVEDGGKLTPASAEDQAPTTSASEPEEVAPAPAKSSRKSSK